jgi:hypothetical protein
MTILEARGLSKSISEPARLKVVGGKLVSVSGDEVTFKGFPDGTEVLVIPHKDAKMLHDFAWALYYWAS